MQSPLEVKQHPMDLRMHGTTPSGLTLYRIVWADTRTTRLYFDGKVHELQRYDEQVETHGKWILEKWLPAEKYIGMTREEYESFMASQPGAPSEQYPTDGEYELVSIFTGQVDPAKTHAFISQLEWRLRNLSLAERKSEVIATHDAQVEERKAEKSQFLDEIVGRNAPEDEVNRIYV